MLRDACVLRVCAHAAPGTDRRRRWHISLLWWLRLAGSGRRYGSGHVCLDLLPQRVELGHAVIVGPLQLRHALLDAPVVGEHALQRL